MKKKVLVVAICMMVAAFFVSSAYAAYAWHTVSLLQVGTASWGDPYIQVVGSTPDTPTTVPQAVYVLSATDVNKSKEMYAAALTASANGGTAQVFIDTVAGNGSPCAGVVVIRP